MEGIILGYNLYDYKSELNVGDLVCIDDEYYNLEKIDPRFLKKEGEPDNENMYIVFSKTNGEPMNFSRHEISKSNIGIFNADVWFKDNKKIMIGNISPTDLRNIKAKASIEWDIPYDKIDSIPTSDIIELTFHGEIIEKEITSLYPDELPTKVKYFKLSY